MKGFLNIIAVLFLTFALIAVINVFVNVFGGVDNSTEPYSPEDPKVKAAAITYEIADPSSSAYSVTTPVSETSTTIYSYNDMLTGFLAWKDSEPGQIRKVEIIPDTYFKEDAQFLKRLNVTENGLIEGNLNIGGYIKVEGEATFEEKVTIDEGEVEINSVEYYFPDTQAKNSRYVLSNDGSGTLSWESVYDVGAGDITSVIAGGGLAGGAIIGDATLDIGAGNGILVNANDIGINLSTTVGAGSTASLSGLEVDSNGLRLLRGCGQTEILVWDDANDIWKCASIVSAGGVTGIGTDNYIPRWNGTDDLESSGIYQTDGGNVGIGTTAPTFSLDVAGTGRFTGQVQIDDVPVVADNNLVLTDSSGIVSAIDSISWDKDSSDDFSGFAETDNRLARFDATGTNIEDSSVNDEYAGGVAVSIDSAGQVGIGTTDPEYKLDIAGGIRTTNDFYVGSIGLNDYLGSAGISGASLIGVFDEFTNTNATNLQAVLNDLDGSITTFASGAGDIEAVGSMAAGEVFADASADDQWLGLGLAAGRIEFDNQAIDEVNILDARLGIGTTTPVYTLDVSGTFRATGTGIIGGELTASSGVNIGTDADSNLISAASTGASSNTLYIGNESILASGDIGTSVQAWNTNLDTMSGLSSADGNFIVGSALGWVAESGDTARTSLGLGTGDSPTFTALNVPRINASSAAGLGLYDDGSTLGVFIQDGGNVGVGSTNPASLFNVGGDNQFQVNSTGNIVRLNGVTTSFPSSQGGAGSVLTNDGAGNLSWGASSGTGILGYWQRNGTDLSPANIGDNVGIGTTAPVARLHVLEDSVGAGQKIVFSGRTDDATKLPVIQLSDGTTGRTILGLRTGDIAVDNSGNIGIGTTAPKGKLDILGANNDEVLTIRSSSGSMQFYPFSNNINYIESGNAAFTASQLLQFTGVGGADGTFNFVGSVGIGITGPGQMLDVSGGNIRTTGQLMSTVATGTAPLSVSSTTVVTNFNADLLDGQTLTSASTINTVVGRDGSGDINVRLVRSEYDTTNATIGYIMTQVDTVSNNYIRPSTPAQVRTGLGLDAGGAADIWVEKAGDTMTGALTMSLDANEVINISATSTNDSRGISFNARTALSSDSSDSWLRLNQGLEFTNGTFTPGMMRADGGFQGAASDTVAAPDFSWSGDTNTGMYHDAADRIGFAANGTRLMSIDGSGIGIGIAPVASRKLYVAGGSSTAIETTSSSGAGVSSTGYTYGVYGSVSGNPGGVGVSGLGGQYGVQGSAASCGGCYDFYASGSAVDYGTSSSIRWKRDLQPIDDALGKVLAMRGLYYTWDEEHGGHRDMGMIAEEVGQIVPEIVGWDSDAPGYATGMDYGHLTPVLVEAIKEQQLQINNLSDFKLAFNDSGELLLDSKIVEIQAEQASQRHSITEILQSLLRLDALESSLVELKGNLNLLAERLNKWDEVMEWSQETADSFASLIFKVPTVFSEIAIFEAPIKVNADTSETIEIPEGTLKAKITFTKKFPENPSIYINFVGTMPIDYKLEDVSVDGFSISFKEATSKNFEIQWLAILRNKSDNSPSVEIFQSDSESGPGSEVPEPVVEEEEISEVIDEEQTGIIPAVIVPSVEESSESIILSTAVVEEDEFGISQEETIVETIEETTYAGIEIGGVVLIKSGDTTAVVETSELSESSTVEVSTKDIAIVTAKVVENGKFEIALDQTYGYDVNVTWVIIN